MRKIIVLQMPSLFIRYSNGVLSSLLVSYLFGDLIHKGTSNGKMKPNKYRYIDIDTPRRKKGIYME